MCTTPTANGGPVAGEPAVGDVPVGAGVAVPAADVVVGRVLGGWQARRAAVYSSITFMAVLLLYVAIRVVGPAAGKFL